MLARNTPYARLTNVVTPVAPPTRPTASAHAINSINWTPAGIAAELADRHSYLEQMSTHPQMQAVAAESLARLALISGQRVLEAGCGTGVFLAALAAGVGATGEVVGVDLSPDFVRTARERGATLSAKVTIEQADVCHLPFPDQSFDAAHCERLLMHLPDPTAALTEMRRVLKPGGAVVAAETDWLGVRIDHPDQGLMTPLVQRGTSAIRQPDMGLTLVRHFAEAGYDEIDARPMIFPVRHLADIATIGLDLPQIAGELIANGAVERTRVEAALTWLEDADRRGAFFAYGGLVVASGRA